MTTRRFVTGLAIAGLTVLMAVFSGCAATMQQQPTPLERVQQEYGEALKLQQRRGEELVAAGMVVETKKGQLAQAYVGAAQGLLGQAEILTRQAETYRQRAEALKPPPKPRADEKKPDPYLDIQVTEFTLPGVKRLTDYPDGWVLQVDGEAHKLTLFIKGKETLSFAQPADFKSPVCYRINPKADPSVGFCPYKLPDPPPSAEKGN